MYHRTLLFSHGFCELNLCPQICTASPLPAEPSPQLMHHDLGLHSFPKLQEYLPQEKTWMSRPLGSEKGFTSMHQTVSAQQGQRQKFHPSQRTSTKVAEGMMLPHRAWPVHTGYRRTSEPAKIRAGLITHDSLLPDRSRTPRQLSKLSGSQTSASNYLSCQSKNVTLISKQVRDSLS